STSETGMTTTSNFMSDLAAPASLVASLLSLVCVDIRSSFWVKQHSPLERGGFQLMCHPISKGRSCLWARQSLSVSERMELGIAQGKKEEVPDEQNVQRENGKGV